MVCKRGFGALDRLIVHIVVDGVWLDSPKHKAVQLDYKLFKQSWGIDSVCSNISLEVFKGKLYYINDSHQVSIVDLDETAKRARAGDLVVQVKNLKKNVQSICVDKTTDHILLLRDQYRLTPLSEGLLEDLARPET